MGKSAVDDDNNPTSPESDPTKLLEAALQQMDGIIAEAGGTGSGSTPSGPARAARSRAIELAQQLALALQHAAPQPPKPDFTTRSAILRWFRQNSMLTALNEEEDRMCRLEKKNKTLELQIQVLSEEISAHREKVADLERDLQETQRNLDNANRRLHEESQLRSSLERQKLALMASLNEMQLQAFKQVILESSPPREPVVRPAPPRTPPANYGRQLERNTYTYSSLPRSSVVSSAFAGREESGVRAGPSGVASLRARLEGADGAGPSRSPRPRTSHMPWETKDVREWDCETTCGWLESLGLEVYVGNARAWLSASPESIGVLATASHDTIEKELAIKHPLHKKKIILALADLLDNHGDPFLTLAGRLDTAWTLRWLEDVGVGGARAAASDAALDARVLHRLTHADLHAHLRVSHATHALSIRRGIQVLRDNNFNPDTMIRRAAEGEGVASAGSAASAVGAASAGGAASAVGAAAAEGAADVARWSSHRVMQWLKEIDLAEYAPNLRGAGVHGGLMLLEPRFTAELLADLLNIPANKTLLRRHLTQKFNDLLGREVIQQKRNAEQTLGYQALTATTKYKVPKKSQFSLRRRKSKDDTELGDLVCPLHEDYSGDITNSPTMKVKSAGTEVLSGVCSPRDEARTH